MMSALTSADMRRALFLRNIARVLNSLCSGERLNLPDVVDSHGVASTFSLRFSRFCNYFFTSGFRLCRRSLKYNTPSVDMSSPQVRICVLFSSAPHYSACFSCVLFSRTTPFSLLQLCTLLLSACFSCALLSFQLASVCLSFQLASVCSLNSHSFLVDL